ncbi:MAG: type III pantothenate kinase [Proteobacteria bacterium]|nr:type III pantothenate kinase [Desulfobulbaceae bacterium]MBU4152398.1 type III pantothenate kinase [Pseudomonadota bacterium]MDP2106079.1 type III pantothenate kinase [Desulfobulbaceae bacterium]
MLLAIDIGNSHTVIGIFNNNDISHHWRIQTNRQHTADEIAIIVHSLFAMSKFSAGSIRGLILASVVPQLNSAWLTFSRTLTADPILVDHHTATGIPIMIDTPAEVGADRIVNAVAGFHRYQQAMIIVDFGTAITFDCISAHGEYLGGAIAPGMGIAIEALGSKTAKLPRVDINIPPPQPIGTNTVSAIQSGILYGYGGLVEGLIQRLKTSFSPQIPKVIATGGMAKLIAPYASSLEEIEPNLTLEGLRLIYERCHE